MNNQAHSRLTNLLIAKSIAEVVLVGALAIVFFFVAFPPYFEGWGEATPNSIAGWAVDRRHPLQPVEVQLFIDDHFVAASFATLARPDIVIAGKAADEKHGYDFEIPVLRMGWHVARVYAVHSSGKGARKTLQLLGDPIEFSVPAGLTPIRRTP
jgi:hypothetical protein